MSVRRVFVSVVTLGFVVNSAVAGGPAVFTDEAIARGITYVPNQTFPVVPFGDGAAFVDLDDDSDPDLVLLGRADGVVGVFENNGVGVFTNRSATCGIPAILNHSGIAAADYDRDGDLDLYISRWGMANRLYRNEGSFTFSDQTAAAGVGNASTGTGAGWGDYDGDGWMDLFVGNRTTANLLYRNLGNGTFSNVAAALGIEQPTQPTFLGTFLDYDRDGDADLYVANDRGAGMCATFHNFLYRNDGGVLVDVTAAANAQACVDAMCIGVGDFDNNRRVDLYITSLALGNSLLMQQPTGVFVESAPATGTSSFTGGWGSVFFDADHDGWLDLYVCNQLAANRLYCHTGTFPCVDLAAACGVADAGESYVTAVADVDNDGDLDLLSVNRYTNVRLFINNENSANHWAKFDIVGRGANRWALGANVDVRTGATWRQREVIAGNNYKSQNELTQHVGLGSAAVMHQVVVTWPGGVTRTITNLASDYAWTIHPPERLGDADGDGDRDLADFAVLAAAFTGDSPGALLPGGEVMDYQGDADVDLSDFNLFLAQYSGPIDDCNANKQSDLLDILLGVSGDVNVNGIADECECLADISPPGGDASVNINDLLDVLNGWGPCSPPPAACPADIDRDLSVNINDLLAVINSWGACP